MHRIILSICLVVLMAACNNEGAKSKAAKGEAQNPATAQLLSQLTEPVGDSRLPLGAELAVSLNFPDSLQLDSIKLYLGGKQADPVNTSALIATSGDASSLRSVSFSFSPEQEQTGRVAFRVQLFFNGGMVENHRANLTFLSDLEPANYSYKVIEEYPHDPKAYTQGLQYEDGNLYEGTGERGSSTIRVTELKTGKILRYRPLESKFFGEGITVFGDKIYQLTYTSQVGFIYNKETLEPLQKIYYQNREGWGLTNNGSELIMSDGTHVIYFLDPDSFTINRQIEVYDDQGPALSLNELEYIDGMIWANRYYTDEIVIIDPQSGRVEGRINLKGILKAADRTLSTDVLNGIAWDKEGRRVFVTGKRWPKLFHIELLGG